ncbi:LysM peptidoglycan-binding domain-containing protein [Yoonia sp. SS1-5]|uniref:LysM peptidoglycan-binding domain-containing protein n=1 Tax=Yoonia rhodophyticola TaxID=3137370 RepID=A0AAN0NKR7_9RHOB
MYKFLTIPTIALALAGPAYAQSDSDDELRSLTSNVLASITGQAPEPVETAEVETDALRGLVEQALSEGQSDAYLEALIVEAADNGQIEVPDAMRTTTGDVDTRTLLASLVAKSEEVDATGTEAQAAEADGAEEELQDQFYEVVAGDSLAAISLTFYGTTQDYIRIFNANRDSLNSPDRIRVGQTLVIPQ